MGRARATLYLPLVATQYCVGPCHGARPLPALVARCGQAEPSSSLINRSNLRLQIAAQSVLTGHSSKAKRHLILPCRLYYCLGAPQARESLIAATICASSTDHPQEAIDHVLSPEARSRDLLCYWSSAGSEASVGLGAWTGQVTTASLGFRA